MRKKISFKTSRLSLLEGFLHLVIPRDCRKVDTTKPSLVKMGCFRDIGQIIKRYLDTFVKMQSTFMDMVIHLAF